MALLELFFLFEVKLELFILFEVRLELMFGLEKFLALHFNQRFLISNLFSFLFFENCLN